MGEKEEWEDTLKRVIENSIWRKAPLFRRRSLIWAQVAGKHGLKMTSLDSAKKDIWRILCSVSEDVSYINENEQSIIVDLNEELNRHGMAPVRVLRLCFGYV
ncbi:MAG: hypothetical protein WC966_01460 [Bradymonadales bacterium]|jgi:hypothetical protein